MKKQKFIFLIAGLALLLAPVMPLSAYYSEGETAGNSAEFGTCTVDPVYTLSYYAKAITGARVRNIACMEGSSVLTTLAVGETVKVIAKTDGWHKVKTASGKTGWVGSTLIKETSDGSSFGTSASTDTNTSSSDLTVRLRGYIVLAVEQRGEAYYINEDNGFYLKDGTAAFNVMRNLGLGISNDNLSKLQKGDYALKNRLKGKIVLAVEKNGEAYYISPRDLSVSYLKDGNAAFQIMRSKGLGITTSDLSKINITTVDGDTTVTNSDGSIALSSKVSGTTASFTWTLSNMTSPMGFKVVYDTHENPVYPGDEYHYLSNSSTRSDSWSNLEPGTYYFRVCEYLGGKCGVYSNNVKVVITDTTTTNSDGSIALSSKVSGTTASFTWTLSNMTSPMGFKVVYDTHENPVYPGDEYHYLSNSSTRSDSWSNLKPGTYYFRVCEYLGGKCGVYSNNVKVVIAETATTNSNGSIALTGHKEDSNVYLNWTLSNITSSMGFKVVYATHVNPVYPGDDYHYLSNASTRSDSWYDLAPGTYYFRTCEYLGGKCGVYSNNLMFNIE